MKFSRRPTDTSHYQKHYSSERFLSKLPAFAKFAGRKILEPAIELYFAATDKDTPAWAKRTIYGALGYLLLPVDVLPDFLPMVGFTDDLGILLAAVAAVATHIKPEHKAKARAMMQKWFKDKDIIEHS